MNNKPPLIILSGPTATGKTDLSVLFAKHYDLEIISADSAQVYKGMDIGSAKITDEEMQGIPHHLIDVCEIDEDYSAFLFKEMADSAMADIYKRGKIPLVVGGTGFYIQALLKDVEFDDEGPDEEYRAELQKTADEKGSSFIHNMLKEVDPESAEKIPEGNVKRVIRAIEYYHLTGKKISEHNSEESVKEPNFNAAYFVLIDDRDVMYERIERRVDKMIEAGLETEVRSLLEKGADPASVAMQAIGYKEMVPFIKGEYSLDEAIYQIKLRTRHFAKRQITWYKREPDVIYINRKDFDHDNEKMSEFMYEECVKRGIL